MDRMNTGALRLGWTASVILDEADQMLDPDFVPTIRRILAHLPKGRQSVQHMAAGDKRAALTELLNDADGARAIVFTRTKRGADKVSRHLEAAGLASAPIHGNRSQPQREHTLAGFRAVRLTVLVATDIAARGIDIDDVSPVIDHELPNVAQSHVHRIGRTAGRFGRRQPMKQGSCFHR